MTSRTDTTRDSPDVTSRHRLRPNFLTSDLVITPTRDQPPHYYCYPRLDEDDQRTLIYCLGSNYLHAGSWISYFNSSNFASLPYPEFRELYFNCLGLNYTQP
ncbi:hypothetical protein RclHR1_00280019 [Rhizophagus clarus]|uniref:Uncharacterized protein n=1 Tax=Rhizophagus clarus TaxID=94130 RepID=A0A2Z6R2K9_9GLOM|nr:hypothetical protein RclHR1_00280019 [Rhizophagus clarus]GES83740.1 hypothetical protein RCL_e12385_RclHR1_00280019 [Rhizophagus clarus]